MVPHRRRRGDHGRRNIERDWIEQMAAQYDPNTYGARINCEHIKRAWPAGEFGAYGDVLACKAEEIDINGQKNRPLRPTSPTRRCWN